MKDRPTKDYVILAAIAAGVAALWIFRDSLNKLFKFAGNPNEGTPYEGGGVVGTLGHATNAILGGVPQAVGEYISSWFAPSGTPGDNVFYTVLFPDGSKHAVGASTVNAQGYFNSSAQSWGANLPNKVYRIGVNSASQKVAVAA